MFITLATAAAFLLCLGAWLKTRREGAVLACCVAGVILGLVLILIPVGHITVWSSIQRFYATQTTIQVARQNPAISALELAAIQQKAVECNQWLWESQYWAKNRATNWFYPKQVLRLRPIK